MIGGTAISTQALLNSSHSHKLGHELEMLFKNRMYVVVLKQKNNMNYDLKAEAGSALLKAEAGRHWCDVSRVLCHCPHYTHC